MTSQTDQNRLYLEKQVLQYFRLIVSTMKEHFQAIEKTSGISGSQLWALSLIKNTPGIKVNEIATAMSILRSSASNLLDKLEEKDLIHRERKDADHRVVRLYATESGLNLATQTPAPPEGIIPYAIHHLSDEKLLELEHSLNNFVQCIAVTNQQAAMTPLSDI